MTVSLQNVVDDILIQIICMLTLEDVLSVRQTSKRLEAITRIRTIWHDQFCFEVLSKGLPIPGTAIPLPEIPAVDLEWRTRLAVQVQRVWTRPTGPLRPVLQRSIPPAQQAAFRVGGRELLTLHKDRFITWRLDGPNELATQNIMLEHVLGADNAWKLHKDSGNLDTIAISNSSGEDVFILADTLDKPPLRRHYSGQVLGLLNQFVLTSASPESGSNIDIYNWVDTSFGFATIRSYLSFFGNLGAFTKFDSHLIFVWEACLTVYPVPALPEADQFTVLDPIQVLFFQFPIQSPVICSPCTPSNLPSGGLSLPSCPKHTKALSICYRVGAGGIHGSIISRNAFSETDTPSFCLARSPFIMAEDCVYMVVGHSGRGLWLDSHNNVYRCSTVSTVTTTGGEYPTLDMGQRGSIPLCTLPEILKDRRGDWALDFDESVGRVVYCNRAGHVSIIDMVYGPTQRSDADR